MDNIGPALLRQALKDARANGWLTDLEATRLAEDLAADGKL